MKKKDLENNEEYVECDSCGHIVSKKRAQTVKMGGYGGYEIVRCELHKLPYDERLCGFGWYCYFKRMEVDEEGTPIGYKKIETPKK